MLSPRSQPPVVSQTHLRILLAFLQSLALQRSTLVTLCHWPLVYRHTQCFMSTMGTEAVQLDCGSTYIHPATCCVLFTVFLWRMPCPLTLSLSHSHSRLLLCQLRALSSCPDGLLHFSLHCITGPMFLSSCFACLTLASENGFHISSLTAVHWRGAKHWTTRGELESWVSGA